LEKAKEFIMSNPHQIRTNRRFLKLSCCAAILLLLSSILSHRVLAQNQQPKKAVVSKQTLIAKDNWPIHITYYQSDDGKEAPVVVLLHTKGGNRLVWEGATGLAQKLHKKGYAVITVDLRKHGESKSPTGAVPETGTKKNSFDSTSLKPNDYKAMVAFDLEAVKRFILKEHINQNLNMQKLAIVAAGMSGPIAVNFAMLDWLKKPYDDAPTFAARTPRGQDVKALALISPDANLPGMQSGKPLLQLRNPDLGIAFMFAVGTKDSLDKGQTRKMYSQVSGITKNKTRTYYQTYPIKLRGTDLFGKGIRIEDHVSVFLDKHLKALEIEWRDRRPRFDRK